MNTLNRVVLKAERRELGSKGYRKDMRIAGKVPGVLYGRGGESLSLSVDSVELGKAINTSAGLNVLLNIELGEDAQEIAMIKDLERDMLKTGAFMHVDFVRISLEDKIEVGVPVVITGEEKRLVDGGVIAQPIREVIVLSSPDAIPEHFSVDVSRMVIGDSVTVADISLPEGCELVTELHEMLVNIMPPRVVQDETTTATEDEEEEASEEEKPEE